MISFKIAIVMRFVQMPFRMRKSRYFPSLMTFPFSPISRSQQAKRGKEGGGEWIHLVLLGMANRCQMGINGPPNVLLQKAFFSAQYFAYIAEQHIHHQLAKRIFRQQVFFEGKSIKQQNQTSYHFHGLFMPLSFQTKAAGTYIEQIL